MQPRILRLVPIIAACLFASAPTVAAEDPPSFRCGFARLDITPPPGLPMWGYAARHDALAAGTRDPLSASALVIEAGGRKCAIVALDLGRGPTPRMMAAIESEAREIPGMGPILVCGSHTHHGPVIELERIAERGGKRFEAAVDYAERLPKRIVEAIRAADSQLRPARIGSGHAAVDFNRNRQAKKRPKLVDPELRVVRIDDASGSPLALLVNFAAHPTMLPAELLEYSADFPGALRKEVEKKWGAPCLFLQGAAGDLSAKPVAGGPPGPDGFGAALATRTLELARGVVTSTPARPSIAFDSRVRRCRPRIDLANPLVQALYGRAFFPELIACAAAEHGAGVDARLTTVLLNGDLALVGVSGEFFSEHAVRLRARLDLPETLFLGYCNGHHYYFPTIEAASEGGYGTEPGICLADLGSGELLMNDALLALYRLMGRLPDESK